MNIDWTAIYSWWLTHESWVEICIGFLVVGSLLYLARRTLRMRRLIHRLRWGAGMKRAKNREAFERGLISFGICDAIEEAVFRGDMTRERADAWYVSFAEDYGMGELLPRKMTPEQLKANINRRITFWERLRVVIPGPPPGVKKIDPNYKPIAIASSLSKSKYTTKAA